MFLNDQKNLNWENIPETVIPYDRLRTFVDRLLRKRVANLSDAEDIAQNVFRRGWQWAESNDKQLSIDEWKRLIAKISFNEINRFYSKPAALLLDDMAEGDVPADLPDMSASPQFIIEIAEELRSLPLRQRLSIVLYEAEILPILKVVLPDEVIAQLLEVSTATLAQLEMRIPLSEDQIVIFIETLTHKPCKSSIRDERCKGRKSLKRRLFGI